MQKVEEKAPVARTEAQTIKRDLRIILLHVAWMSIGLGVIMQVLLILGELGAFPQLQTLIADFGQKITWSFVVCMGLAVGEGVAGTKPPVAGLAGLIAAPLAFNLAHAVHSSIGEMVGANLGTTDTTQILLISLLRGMEYFCLGVTLRWIGEKAWGNLRAHLLVGLVVGIIFGVGALALSYEDSTSVLAWVSWLVNELLFPVGCSLIIFSSDALAKRLKPETDDKH